MPAVTEDNGSIEESFTYASYERDSEYSFILSSKKSRKFGSKSTLYEDSVKAVDQNEQSTHAPRSRQVILMAACLWLNLSCFGMVIGLGVIYVELISAFQCQRSEAALVQSLFMGLSLGCAIVFSKIVTKYDTGACVMAASFVVGVAMACGSLAQNIGTVIALIGVIAGSFASVNILSSSIIINWTFVDNRRFALGILTFGATIGQTVTPYISYALIEEYTWSGCLLILSALTFFNCIPCGLIIHYSKRYFHTGGKTNSQDVKTSYCSFFLDSAFIVYMLSSFIFTTFGPVEQWFVVDVAVLKGFGIQDGAVLLSLNGIFGFVGRILGTIILKLYPNTRPELHKCNGFLFWAIAHFSVVASPVYWGMVLAMILRGLTTGIIITCLPSLQLELKGSDKFPQTVAITNLLMGAGDIIGGYFGGYSVDVTGSYSLIFYIATAGSLYCTISMLVIYVILKNRRRNSGLYQKLP